jgi:hypothetical protein
MPPRSSGLHGRQKQEKQLFRDQSYCGGYAPSFHQDFCHPDHLAQFMSEVAHLADDLLLSTCITDPAQDGVQCHQADDGRQEPIAGDLADQAP